MNNLFDNTGNNDSGKASQDSAQARDDDPNVPAATNPNPSEPQEKMTFPESEPEISHFLKNKADEETGHATGRRRGSLARKKDGRGGVADESRTG